MSSIGSLPTRSTHKLTDAKALVFDVYGTLVDRDSGIYATLKHIVPPTWSKRDALTAFDEHELDLQGRFPDMLMADILVRAHEALCQQLGVTSEDPDAHKAFGRTMWEWPVFPDTVDALRRLAEHFKLIVLSNVDRASFAYTHYALSGGTSTPASEEDRDAFTAAHSPFTLVLTAQDVGAYKPSLVGFEAVLARIHEMYPEITREKVFSTAQSLVHDHVPANKLGLGSVWISRSGEGPVPEGVFYGWRFTTLGDMAEGVKDELKICGTPSAGV